MAILTQKPKRGSGGHWYTSDGKAMHTMPLQSGDGERNTTLRDAKKLGLYPSVTTLLGLFAKPGLDRWKQDQLLNIAFSNPPKAGESYEDYANRCLVEHEKPVEEAADFGTEVHDAIEAYYKGSHIPDHLLGYIQPALDWKQENQLTFIEFEKMLVNKENGFAGTVDIVGKGVEDQMFIVDWKTRRTKPKVKVAAYDFQVHQIAAYAATYWGEENVLNHRVHGANCFISSTEEGRFEVVKYSPEELADAWLVFRSICKIWRSLKGYDPRTHPNNA